MQIGDVASKTYALKLAYDGTRYAGWQIQPNGLAVQQVLAQSISKAIGHKVCVQGSGRTDAGVHAQGQVAAFSTPFWNHDPIKLVRAINRFLPRDISVLHCQRVVDSFDPIRNAVSKSYRYTIRNSNVPDPLRYGYHWWIPRELDVQAMQNGASQLLGTLDFKAFETLGSNRKTSVRTVLKLEVTQSDALAGREITIDIQADGFLYNMVRNITGALVEIGRGRFEPIWLDECLRSRQRALESQTAPARGLCMMNVEYPTSVFLDSDHNPSQTVGIIGTQPRSLSDGA
jgi:tRNA pseudouridine38-40 synthase